MRTMLLQIVGYAVADADHAVADAGYAVVDADHAVADCGLCCCR